LVLVASFWRLVAWLAGVPCTGRLGSSGSRRHLLPGLEPTGVFFVCLLVAEVFLVSVVLFLGAEHLGAFGRLAVVVVVAAGHVHADVVVVDVRVTFGLASVLVNVVIAAVRRHQC